MELNLLIALALAFGIGLSLGLLGSGGSIITLPVLVYVAGVPVASGAFLVAALAGMASGARLSGRIAPVTMRRAFGWFVLAVAAFVLVNH